ncbi:MAG: polysaccharide biosynthesis protein [Gammaproteobacteria bacterium]|nr:MAG: polysaccharide biosynthesis protein [Gammaproteobacteria bacterium]
MSLIERALQKTDSEDDRGKSRSQHIKRRHGKISPTKALKDLQKMIERNPLSNKELTKLGIATDRKTANNYRELRTELLKVTHANNSVLAISACKDNSGTSFVAKNLAVSFAQDSTKSALLVDCNFRNPSFAKTFDMDIGADLTDYLTGDVAVEEIIYSVGVNNLRVIPSRESRISEIDNFATSSKLGELIYQLKNRYPDRYIILDVADMKSSADAKILDLIADYSVLVAGHDTVTEDELRIAIDGFNPSKFLGIIYNHCPS